MLLFYGVFNFILQGSSECPKAAEDFCMESLHVFFMPGQGMTELLE